MERRVGYQLKRAQHALRGGMDEVLREIGMTTAQYAALSALEAEAGLSGADLARRSFVTPQTMNQILTRLERDGMISRRAHPRHGRVLRTDLSKEGRRKLAEAHKLVEEVEAKMLKNFDDAEIRQLSDALRRCAESLE
ncbi:MAG TPA: MarR family transcriptional regulator [Rubrobacteraceae bacterium]|nr:MarR family transcriptional regulator [Rubrobacteraceae bacterium]